MSALDLRSFVREGEGSNTNVPNYLFWDGDQLRDSVGSARVDPALNGYLEKSGEGKQEGCAKSYMALRRRSAPQIRTLRA